jgi:hypothetical protein
LICKHTNFSGTCISVETHGARRVAVSITAGTHQVREEALARLERLHGKMAAHRFWNALTVFTILNALSCDVLDFGASVMVLVGRVRWSF